MTAIAAALLAAAVVGLDWAEAIGLSTGGVHAMIAAGPHMAIPAAAYVDGRAGGLHMCAAAAIGGAVAIVGAGEYIAAATAGGLLAQVALVAVAATPPLTVGAALIGRMTDY